MSHPAVFTSNVQCALLRDDALRVVTEVVVFQLLLLIQRLCRCLTALWRYINCVVLLLFISEGSITTHLRCGGIFSDSTITNFRLILTVKKV